MSTPTVRGFRTLAAGVAVAALSLLAACSGGSQPAEQVDKITFWTPHVTPERIAVQKEVAAKFTEQTGIAVDVVPLAAADQNTTLVAGAASGDVPDVILHGSEAAPAWVDQGLLDTEAAGQVIDELDPKTFAAGALTLSSIDGKPTGVPMDGWGHLLVYRKDLFAAAGLKAPKSIADVAAASTRLAQDGKIGIALGTQAGNAFTRETMEAMLLANDCQLVRDGQVSLNSPQCVNGLRLYQQMAASAGKGELDVDAARAAYLAGDAGMLVFSSHILDELAGLDPNNPVTCDECTKDKNFLAKNSGFVIGLSGPDNPETRQFGAVLQLGIPEGAHTAQAQQFAKFLLTDGYLDSVGSATEGRIPVRLGTPEQPTEYVDGWSGLPFGAAGDGSSIKDVYGAEVATAISAGSENYDRWGAGTPDALLASVVSQQNVIPQNLGTFFAGGDPAEVAGKLQSAVESVQQELQ